MFPFFPKHIEKQNKNWWSDLKNTKEYMFAEAIDNLKLNFLFPSELQNHNNSQLSWDERTKEQKKYKKKK